ncbi:MAG: prephenate dehydratase domain-containing protein, partial [Anaerolineae bacterium]
MMGEIVVAFQGEHGAYSEEAVYQHFPRETETLPCHSLKEIFEAIESGRATHGMLPVENSTAGSINQSYD